MNGRKQKLERCLEAYDYVFSLRTDNMTSASRHEVSKIKTLGNTKLFPLVYTGSRSEKAQNGGRKTNRMQDPKRP